MNDNLNNSTNPDLDDKFKEMIERSVEIQRDNTGARDELNQAKALTQRTYKARKVLAETEKKLLDLYIKHDRVVDLKTVRKKAKKIAKASVKKEKLGLTQGDKLWGKEGLKARGGKGLQVALHTAGLTTGNPLFNLAANAWGRRRSRISESRQKVYDEDRESRLDKREENHPRVDKFEENRLQNEAQERLKTNTNSAEGNGTSDQSNQSGDFEELVAEAKTSNKLLNLLVNAQKDEVRTEQDQTKQLELFNANQKEALEDEELTPKTEEDNKTFLEKSKDTEKSKDDNDENELEKNRGFTDMIYGMGALSSLFTKLIPLLSLGGPVVVGLAGVAALGSVINDALDAHEKENKKEREEVDQTLTNVKKETEQIEQTTTEGSDERTRALQTQRDLLKIQAKKVKNPKVYVDNIEDEEYDQAEAITPNFNNVNEHIDEDPDHPGQHREKFVEWIDSIFTTEHEQKEIDDIEEVKQEIQRKITHNKAVAQKQMKSFLSEDHTGEEKQDFFAPKIKALEEEIKKSEEKISSLQEDGSFTKENKDYYVALNTNLSNMKEELEKYKSVLSTSQNITSNINKNKDHYESTQLVEEKNNTEPKNLSVAKSKPIKTQNSVEFSKELSSVELMKQKKESAILEEYKRNNQQLLEKSIKTAKKYGENSEQYKKIHNEYTLNDEKMKKYQNEITQQRLMRETQRKSDIKIYGVDKASQMEADREHMRISKDNQPVFVNQSSNSSSVAPNNKSNVIVSTRDDSSFGNKLYDQQ